MTLNIPYEQQRLRSRATLPCHTGVPRFLNFASSVRQDSSKHALSTSYAVVSWCVNSSLWPQKQVHQLQLLDDAAAQKLAAQRAEAAAAQKATPSADIASSAATGIAGSSAGSSAYVPVPGSAKSAATTRITAFTPSYGAPAALFQPIFEVMTP